MFEIKTQAGRFNKEQSIIVNEEVGIGWETKGFRILAKTTKQN